MLDEQVMVLDHLGQRGGSGEGAAWREEARVMRERGEVLRQFIQRAEPGEVGERS